MTLLYQERVDEIAALRAELEQVRGELSAVGHMRQIETSRANKNAWIVAEQLGEIAAMQPVVAAAIATAGGNEWNAAAALWKLVPAVDIYQADQTKENQ